MNKQIISEVTDNISSHIGTPINEVHNRLFNEDYFIIGHYQAEEFLNSTSEGVFGAVQLIKEYEQDNFGEVSTDFSNSEQVANMYAYIKGEELLNSLDSITDNWDEELTKELVKEILEEIEDNY